MLLFGRKRGGGFLGLEDPARRSRQDATAGRCPRAWRRGSDACDLGRIGIDPGADPDDLDRDVVQAAAQIGQVDQVAAGVARVEIPREGADLLVVDRPGEAVGAEQVDVAELDGQRALEIDLDFGSGPRLRVMTFLGTERLACSGVRWLRRTSSQTRL